MEERARDEMLERLLGGGAGADDKSGGETNAMVRPTAMSEQAYKYLISTDKKMALDDLLMRTIFASREEQIIFIDYCGWCLDFDIGLDHAIRYAASRPAVGGLARDQLVTALNTFRFIEQTNNKKKKGDDDKRAIA